jgi:predicted NUDIX family phosphoesterase
VFHYARGKQGGEARLHAKRSIGIGGHISTIDAEEESHAYSVGMWRELNEEVSMPSGFEVACVGLINDDLTPVGRVHLGVVHVFDLEAAKVHPREESITETGFAEPAELIHRRDSFETWSQICLDHLF